MLGDGAAEIDVEPDHLARLGVRRREGRHVGEGAAAQFLARHDVVELVGAGDVVMTAIAASARLKVFNAISDLLEDERIADQCRRSDRKRCARACWGSLKKVPGSAISRMWPASMNQTRSATSRAKPIS